MEIIGVDHSLILKRILEEIEETGAKVEVLSENVFISPRVKEKIKKLAKRRESVLISNLVLIKKSRRIVRLKMKEVFEITPQTYIQALEEVKRFKIDEARKKGAIVFDDVFISFDSEIEEGAFIEPNVFIISSKIGRATIMRGSTIIKSEIGYGAKILPYSYIEGLRIEGEEVEIGPMARIRPQTIIKSRVKVGSFAEVKNSVIGEESKIQHFSYIGDADVGVGVNIGAGTVTCNFDGVKKNKTIIEDKAFVGSGSMLIAPIRIGRFAYIGAGSSISKEVPPYSLAVERAETKIIQNWVKKKFNLDT